MRKLEKSTIALTFKFDCDRFLRFRLASAEEKISLGIGGDHTYKRPGIELIKAAGRRWGADKYQDLITVASAARIEHRVDPIADPLAGQPLFGKIDDVFDLLRRAKPPLAIIEGEFQVPLTITPNLKEAYETYDLETAKARPDILWIRRFPTGSPLIPRSLSDAPPYEIHIIDVKMAAEPSLRHFTEVTYYALALAAALEEQGLTDRYAVSAEGYIWPGNHDANAFRNLYRSLQSQGHTDPITRALLDTLISVPYEVYQVHVRQFFEERLPRVLAQAPLEAKWHVAQKCQLCDYVRFCTQKAADTDHLSRIPWLNQGQAELLVSQKIERTADLTHAIRTDSPEWQAAERESHQLRADKRALLARARALQTGQVHLAEGRRCTFMPKWSDLSVFLTVHFDPGSGIAFSLGAGRVYFPPGRKPSEPPIVEQQVFIVDRVNQMNPDTERARLVEFVRLVIGWLLDVASYNEQVTAREAKSAHIFFWDSQEMTQLWRMVQRHIDHTDVMELVEGLIRLFPPDYLLPDPDMFRSLPGTAVKNVFKLLVGLPIPHTYTLLDVANCFYPNTTKQGEPYRYNVPFGFSTEMSDQIPFERAYELWQDRVLLRHYDPAKPSHQWPLYSRHQIYEGIQKATVTRLQALEHVVQKLRKHHGDLLTLRKAGLAAARSARTKVPKASRNLIAFEKLNVVFNELENRQARALPLEEREARFICIRGLRLATGGVYDRYIDDIRLSQPQYVASTLYAFTFAPTSRDARIREGDFLLAFSNESPALDLDIPWRIHAGLSFADAVDLSDLKTANAPLSRLLTVTLVKLEVDPPFLVIAPSEDRLFQLAQSQGLLDLGKPLVLDPLYQDFTSERIASALKVIGGDVPSEKRRKRL